ncbi:MAG: hypothetical protein Unbinned4052contig1001_10 [Prokaryotic dsDNA virus sp.]|nr:MAG: hypothetical protein Unbinned4052contig1001_10 [Prokaryotic dsDNA virus sp.]|tara:strand:- start:1011 stop:1508 length:498 start_codon:yes stop_codon:yes gene_type:complete
MALVSALALAGCAANSGNPAQVSYSGFDDAKVVTISRHAASCEGFICPNIGFQWVESKPDDVLVSAGMLNITTAILGAQLKIDGEVYPLSSTASITGFTEPGDIMRESSKSFVTGVGVVRKLSSSDDSWIRVETSEGLIDAPIADENKKSRAYYAAQRFITEVDQ